MLDVNTLKNELEQTKRSLALRELELKSLQTQIPISSLDGLVLTDPRRVNNPIVWVNKAFEKITGYSLLEVLGKSCNFLQGEDRNQPDINKLRSAINSHQECRVVLRNYKKDGTVFWNELTIMPSFDSNHNLTGYVGIIQDVTRDKEIDRMKSEFISLASHQLRTPLTSVKWFCELVSNEKVGPLNPKQKEYLHYISSSTNRMIALVNSLLNVSRIESGRLEIKPLPTNLGELLNSIVKDLTPQFAQKQIKFVCDVQVNLPLISVDPTLIRQVYLNLLTNALKYTSLSGTIIVLIRIEKDSVVSIVKDSGLGIPKKDFARVFQKFFRSENVVRKIPDGNGLGLYLVKSIVELSGGKIWFESVEKQGTTFYFSLPLSGSNPKSGEVKLI